MVGAIGPRKWKTYAELRCDKMYPSVVTYPAESLRPGETCTLFGLTATVSALFPMSWWLRSDVQSLRERGVLHVERIETTNGHIWSFLEIQSPNEPKCLSGQTSMVKVTLELGQCRLGNWCGDVLLDTWAGLNVAYPLMGLRGTRLTWIPEGGDVGGDKNELRVTCKSWQLEWSRRENPVLINLRNTCIN